jgi:phosphoribosylglycinamide formyltransferase-1
MRQPLKLAFLASANGSSARAIVAACETGRLAAEPRLMVSNNRSAPALDFAREHGIAALCIPTQADPEGADARLAEALHGHGADFVVMSGYLRRLGPRTTQRFAGRILNIHPGPLPAFGGEGMYGRRVHEAVVAAGARESAVTIHLVDEEYDRGPTLAVKPVPVLDGDTAETLEARVRGEEPSFYVETLRRIASGELKLP